MYGGYGNGNQGMNKEKGKINPHIEDIVNAKNVMGGFIQVLLIFKKC